MALVQAGCNRLPRLYRYKLDEMVLACDFRHNMEAGNKEVPSGCGDAPNRNDHTNQMVIQIQIQNSIHTKGCILLKNHKWNDGGSNILYTRGYNKTLFRKLL